MTRIGILALQGAFVEHEPILRDLGAEAIEVRLPHHLEGIDGLIIPGGESTTIGKLAATYQLLPHLAELSQNDLPIWGICAGMIVLAKRLIPSYDQPLVGTMELTVRRNAFGRQVDSFEADIPISCLDEVAVANERGQPFRSIFIRAPFIEAVGKGVEVLARLQPEGPIVAAQQGSLLAVAFHPELTRDNRFHRYFLHLVD
jgi:5'-phosphate synthase pdxT subunit